jgi:hypothetical protein
MRSSIAAPSGPTVRRPACDVPLPFQISLGPYHLGVEFRARARMTDRRRLACINLEAGRIELRNDLEGLRLARAFFDCVVRLSHFSKGCQQGCVEEAYTHSFATGIVEFAQRNPRAWAWFNLLLSEHLGKRAHFDRVVRGAFERPPRMPRRILVADRPVTIRSIPRSQTGGAFGWYHFSRREAQLYRGLTGANIAIVALHEITHAVHHAYGLKQRDRHLKFRHAQVDGWLSIMRSNPGAWRWLVWVITFPALASVTPGSRRAA